MEEKPYISVVIPVKNGGSDFEQCLKGIRSSEYSNYELLVVNDASTDDTPQLAEKYGARVLHTADFPFEHKPDYPFQDSMGPAGARNIGVQHAKGEIIYFIDGDVVPKKDNLTRVANIFKEKKDIAAVFGSYDESPGHNNFLSQYRNLLHTYIHQISLVDAETFWTGCGAIRKDIFLKMSGFDLKTFRLPSIEDIDLGYRMKDAGYKIYLDKKLRVKHLKKWTFKSMLKTDVFHRAIPWARIMFTRGSMRSDLNIQTHHRISGAIVLSIFIIVFTALLYSLVNFLTLMTSGHTQTYFNVPLGFGAAGIVFLQIVSVVLLNIKFYSFLKRTKGLAFTVKAIPVHFFYYLYSTVSFIVFLMDFYIPPFRWLRKRLGFITHV